MDREKLISLVSDVQKGSDDAVSEMYEAFHDDIYYYIYKTVNDPELAADLTQDTFIEILQSIGSLQEPAAFITWSRQLAYRRCTAYFKKRHDYLVDEDEEGYSVFDTLEEERTEFIPGEALDKEELKQAIHEIIRQLPEEQRAAIMMRYFEEISVADIAKIQGVSEGTVKSRLNYGRKAIGKAVEEYEKKHGIKLHCAGVIPLLLWLLREQRLANGGSAAGAASTAASVTAATGTATTGAATSAASAAVAAKTIGGALAAKWIACVAAAVVAISGVGIGISQSLQKDTPPEHTQPSSTAPGFVLPAAPCADHNTQPLAAYKVAVQMTVVPAEGSTPGDVQINEGAIIATDYVCWDCRKVCISAAAYLFARPSPDCDHQWESTLIASPYANYTRGYCTACEGYDILNYYINPCRHQWVHGRCTQCDYLCKHSDDLRINTTDREKEECLGCGANWEGIYGITCYIGYSNLSEEAQHVVTVCFNGDPENYHLMTYKNRYGWGFLTDEIIAQYGSRETDIYSESHGVLYYVKGDLIHIEIEFISRGEYEEAVAAHYDTYTAADGQVYYRVSGRNYKTNYVLDFGMGDCCARIILSAEEATMEELESIYFHVLRG